MRIAIHGRGRMGQAVERIARERGHEVVATFDRANPVTPEPLRGADVLVDFSHASALDGLVAAASAGGTPLVVGTTGWDDRREEVERRCRDGGVPMVWASNFSPGANILFLLAGIAADRAATFGGYEAGVEERHHAKKKDAPSGTALRIAAEVREGSGGAIDPPIASSRVGAEFGLHALFFDSPDDLLEITHRARGRDGFARGAVLAAERIHGMSGVYRFEQLIAMQEDRHGQNGEVPRRRRGPDHTVPR
ncbi:MAG: 4-hydroxy-tetrahydrodipicolinate reductase [Thermoanaerobaculia bacterium]